MSHRENFQTWCICFTCILAIGYKASHTQYFLLEPPLSSYSLYYFLSCFLCVLSVHAFAQKSKSHPDEGQMSSFLSSLHFNVTFVKLLSFTMLQALKRVLISRPKVWRGSTVSSHTFVSTISCPAFLYFSLWLPASEA